MPAATAQYRQLRKRREYLAAARGKRVHTGSFSLQSITSTDALPGLGITVTNKVGNAPERNRIRRRLRAAASTCASSLQPQHSYVLIGRRAALNTPYSTLVSDLQKSIARIHADPKARQRSQ